ncbi:MAG TPA: helix-hairpin-helix domain-containing protein [Thermodesulfobacteriota bacterium]|nr:helix-hairpin-helix domain-containing protein [Thermodesulfobacteriota bacterium]
MTEIVEKEAYGNSAALLLLLSLLIVLFAKPYFNAPREADSGEVEAAIAERLRFEATPPERFVLHGTIDINSAGVEELSLLPGVGESLAQSIVSRRMALGGFRTTEELKTVKGIGEAKFSAIKTYVRVEAAALGNKKGR